MPCEWKLPAYVLDCLHTLENAGFEAWCVGGCVRDFLLGKEPHDFDMATNARPHQVAALFVRHLDVGLRYGTITVLSPEGDVEITTYRTDGTYRDHRRPEEVQFSSTLREDVSRRDFTINAMAYHPVRGIQDFFGGREDLAHGEIRTVGDARQRFREDALRILRAFRFSCQLDFAMEAETLHAALELRHTLEGISRERVTQELLKALLSRRPSRLSPLFGNMDLGKLDDIAPAAGLRLAALCLLTGVPLEALLPLLRLPALLQKEALQYACQLSMPLPGNRGELKRRFKSLAPERWPLLLSTYTILRGQDTADVREALEQVIRGEEPWNVSHLAVNGNDLVSHGIAPGKEVGTTLNRLLEEVLERPEANTKEYLLTRI